MTQASSEYSYVGSELELFAGASNWKNYWSSRLRPYIHGDVLDVGAGLGATFDYLADAAKSWTCLEPDPALCAQLEERLAGSARPPRVVCGTTGTLDPSEKFDAIVYIDVLEHIEDDRGELRRTAERLRSGGSLIVLSPALPSLYSAFDRSVGHFRRYTKASLMSVTPDGLLPEAWFFLDGIGVAASLFARLTGRGQPAREQIRIWDKLLVPISRKTDFLTGRLFGRSIIGVWKKA